MSLLYQTYIVLCRHCLKLAEQSWYVNTVLQFAGKKIRIITGITLFHLRMLFNMLSFCPLFLTAQLSHLDNVISGFEPAEENYYNVQSMSKRNSIRTSSAQPAAPHSTNSPVPPPPPHVTTPQRYVNDGRFFGQTCFSFIIIAYMLLWFCFVFIHFVCLFFTFLLHG